MALLHESDDILLNPSRLSCSRSLAVMPENELQIAPASLLRSGGCRLRRKCGRNSVLHRSWRHSQLPCKGRLIRELDDPLSHVCLRGGQYWVRDRVRQTQDNVERSGNCTGSGPDRGPLPHMPLAVCHRLQAIQKQCSSAADKILEDAGWHLTFKRILGGAAAATTAIGAAHIARVVLSPQACIKLVYGNPSRARLPLVLCLP